ncbi:hypothetical protein [Polymorphum gilvum]|uniref:Uncharacterized protein n=1 Tax=Polymorphum gilvum (strain LMG 25793 / CGMCC 1.9160 / SL003B-26A1) TaxID=991905 RepID=F2J660_POLGS|nr:hypothetical protein [Polymorphum gilvum]ADZ72424.1 hypothetical protein SL003B_4004 [Polymorphum gilvum SL003B-26A1]
MSEALHDLVDDILASVFDGCGPDTPASIAAAEVAARLLSGGTSRADLVQSISRLIVAVDQELRQREMLHREAAERARLVPAPTGRRWRVTPLLDLMLPDLRRDGQADPTPTLMGDPAPGRSALDQMTSINRRI